MSDLETAPSPVAASVRGQDFFAQARERLNAFLRRGASSEAMPAAEAPEVLINLIAGRPLPGQAEALEGLEAISAYALGRGLVAEAVYKAPSAFHGADFPVLALMAAGHCRLLVGRKVDRFAALGSTGSYTIPLFDLQQEAGATALLLRRASEVAEEVLEDDPVAEAIRFVRERQGRMLAQLMVAAALSNLLLLALPIYSGLVFDRVIPHAAIDTLWAVSLGVFFALSADLALRWVRLKIQDAIASRASATLQLSILRRLLHCRLEKAPRVAGAMSVRLREIEHLAQTVPQLIIALVIDAPFLLLVFTLIWFNGGPVVLAPVLGILVLAGVHHLSHRASAQPMVKAARLAQNQTNRVIEAVDGLETIKTSRLERRLLGRFEVTYAEYAYTSHIGRFWHGFSAYASSIVGQMMIVLVMVFGVYQVTSGAMTIGALTSCTLLVSRIIAPVGQLVALVHRAHQIGQTLEAVSSAGREAQEGQGDTSGARSAPIRGDIRFDKVAFAHSGQGTPQVEGMSFAIRPGEKVAIIGRSGSGKSTLLRLMLRLYEPTSGAVLLDGMDSRQFEPQAMRAAIAYLGQTPGLMDDTLLANLTLGAQGADPEKIDAIAALAGVKEIAARHPEGYGLPVGPRGEALSGGERQAVALARTLLSDAKVFVLDEPSAAMDTILEARLARDLKAVLAGRTVILATHRAPMLELVDRLIWIERGRLVADGPKEEVLRRLRGAA